ncbi:hypothetical protein ABFX02_06G047900 [Erythranthe guttata]
MKSDSDKPSPKREETTKDDTYDAMDTEKESSPDLKGTVVSETDFDEIESDEVDKNLPPISPVVIIESKADSLSRRKIRTLLELIEVSSANLATMLMNVNPLVINLRCSKLSNYAELNVETLVSKSDSRDSKIETDFDEKQSEQNLPDKNLPPISPIIESKANSLSRRKIHTLLELIEVSTANLATMLTNANQVNGKLGSFASFIGRLEDCERALTSNRGTIRGLGFNDDKVVSKCDILIKKVETLIVNVETLVSKPNSGDSKIDSLADWKLVPETAGNCWKLLISVNFV